MDKEIMGDRYKERHLRDKTMEDMVVVVLVEWDNLVLLLKEVMVE